MTQRGDYRGCPEWAIEEQITPIRSGEKAVGRGIGIRYLSVQSVVKKILPLRSTLLPHFRGLRFLRLNRRRHGPVAVAPPPPASQPWDRRGPPRPPSTANFNAHRISPSAGHFHQNKPTENKAPTNAPMADTPAGFDLNSVDVNDRFRDRFHHHSSVISPLSSVICVTQSDSGNSN